MTAPWRPRAEIRKSECTEDGCTRNAVAHGVCDYCYKRLGIRSADSPMTARALRTIEIRTFPRLNDTELAALFGIPFGIDEITEAHA